MGIGFCQLLPFTKRQRAKGENAFLAILQKYIFCTTSTRFFLTVHILQSKNISRLSGTAVISVMGCSRPHTVRGFGFFD